MLLLLVRTMIYDDDSLQLITPLFTVTFSLKVVIKKIPLPNQIYLRLALVGSNSISLAAVISYCTLVHRYEWLVANTYFDSSNQPARIYAPRYVGVSVCRVVSSSLTPPTILLHIIVNFLISKVRRDGLSTPRAVKRASYEY